MPKTPKTQTPARDPWPWIVAAITLAVFLPTLGNGFVNWDDDLNFLENPSYRGLGPTQLKWMWSTFLMGHYHPLTWMTLGLDYSLWGMNPAGYHFTSALLHALAAAFAYLAFVQLIRLARQEEEPSKETRYGAVLGALIFSLHPLRVESVAWASERRDIVCGVFYLATIWLYLKGRKVGAAFMFTGALLSKVLAATLPGVLLILDLYPLRRRLTPRLLIEKLPFIALAVGAIAIGVGRYENGVPGAVGHAEFYGPLRIALSLYALAFYLWKTVVPFGLYSHYVGNLDPQPLDPQFVVAGAAFGALAIVALIYWKRYPFLLAALAAYGITLAPVLSFVRLDRQLYVADHHSYLATVGVAAIAGALLASRPSFAWPARGLIVILALLSIQQTLAWKDSRTLWDHTLEGTPLSFIAHNNLARVYAAEGDDELAIGEFEQAIEIHPNYSHAYYNLAMLFMQRGDLAAAESRFARSAELLRSPQTLSDWANCLLRQGRATEAVGLYEEAIKANPGFADAHHNLGVALEFLGQTEAAQSRYREADRLRRGQRP